MPKPNLILPKVWTIRPTPDGPVLIMRGNVYVITGWDPWYLFVKGKNNKPRRVVVGQNNRWMVWHYIIDLWDSLVAESVALAFGGGNNDNRLSERQLHKLMSFGFPAGLGLKHHGL